MDASLDWQRELIRSRIEDERLVTTCMVCWILVLSGGKEYRDDASLTLPTGEVVAYRDVLIPEQIEFVQTTGKSVSQKEFGNWFKQGFWTASIDELRLCLSE